MASYPSRRYIRSKAGTTGITIPGQAVITAADYAAIRTLLSLGSAAQSSSTDFAASIHTHTVSQLSDATANGRSLISAADYAAMRSLLSLGTAAQSDTGDFESAGAVAAHAALKAGVHGKVCTVLASPFTITASGTNTTVLTLSLPVGVHYLSYSLSFVHTVNTTWTPRIISGTAVLGGVTGYASGHCFGGTGLAQANLTKGSPDVFTLRGAGSALNLSVSGHGVLINVTTAGTIEFQVSANQAGTVVQAGSVIFAEAL